MTCVSPRRQRETQPHTAAAPQLRWLPSKTGGAPLETELKAGRQRWHPHKNEEQVQIGSHRKPFVQLSTGPLKPTEDDRKQAVFLTRDVWRA